MIIIILKIKLNLKKNKKHLKVLIKYSNFKIKDKILQDLLKMNKKKM